MVKLPGSVLIDMPNWLGDFVHTVPALDAIRSANRGGRTTVVLPAAHAPLAAMLGVDAIVRPPRAGYRWARRALFAPVDVVLTARHSTRAKLLLAGTCARLKLASCGRGAETLGLSTFAVDRDRHQCHDLDLALRALGLPPVAVAARLELPSRLTQRGWAQRVLLAGRAPVVAIFPATRHNPAKRYPLAHMANVVAELERVGVVSLVIVGPGEENVASSVASPGFARIVPTSWTLIEVAALLSACDAALGNDSGLTHLAALVGCPTVALFGPTEPARTAPFGRSVVVRPESWVTGTPILDTASIASEGVVQSLLRTMDTYLGLRASATEAMIVGGSGPLAQLAEQGTLNP
jgi:ADP-heptose:LPS heptosyltransferase